MNNQNPKNGMTCTFTLLAHLEDGVNVVSNAVLHLGDEDAETDFVEISVNSDANTAVRAYSASICEQMAHALRKPRNAPMDFTRSDDPLTFMHDEGEEQ